jgi:hypothetical protein
MCLLEDDMLLTLESSLQVAQNTQEGPVKTSQVLTFHTIKAVDNRKDMTKETYIHRHQRARPYPISKHSTSNHYFYLTHPTTSHHTKHTFSTKHDAEIKILMIVSGRYIEPALYTSNAICTKMPMKKVKRKKTRKEKKDHMQPSHPQIKNATKQPQNRPIYE